MTYPIALASVLIFLTGIATGGLFAWQYLRWMVYGQGARFVVLRRDVLRALYDAWPTEFHEFLAGHPTGEEIGCDENPDAP